MTRVTIIAVMALTTAFCQNQSKKDLAFYEWNYNGDVHGRLWVPNGYKAETENYREGIVTHLRYPDSSCIVLQHGFMYGNPMLSEPQFVVNKKGERDDRSVRSGSIRGTDLFWREDKIKRISPKGKKIHSLFQVLPPNIAYKEVSKDRVDLFNKSMESFVWNSAK
jgi:hypothetical protein